MALKFLADENISPLTVRLVRELGYDIKDINEEGLTGIEDEDIVRIAEEQDRIILTFDLDFGEIYYFATYLNVGILVLRIKPQTVELANEVLEKFLKTKVLETKKLSKSLVILDPKKYRSRKKS